MFSRSPYRRIGLVAISAFTTCSHLKKATISNANSQHTTFSLGRCWYQQGMPARQLEGRGQLFHPLHLSHPQRCGCQSRLQHDVHLGGCSTGRLRRGETAAVPERFFKGGCFLSGRLAQLCFRHAVLPRLAPRFTSIVSSVRRGDPGRQRGIAWAIPVPPMVACAGTAAVSHRLADPVVSTASSQLWHQFRCPSCTLPGASAMPAAEHRAVRLLVPTGEIVWCPQAGPI